VTVRSGRILVTAALLLTLVVTACTPAVPNGATDPGDGAGSTPSSESSGSPSEDGTASSAASPSSASASSEGPSSDGSGGTDSPALTPAPTSASPSSPTEPTSAPTVDGGAAGETPPIAAGSDVVPTVVYAAAGPDSRVRVNSFVPGVVEDGGTCSAVLTGASGTTTASASAFADATATWCDELVLDAVDGAVSGWRVVVSYSSPAHQGTSTSTAVSNS